MGTAAQQLLASITSPLPTKAHPLASIETPQATVPKFAHFFRPPSADASPSGGFSFGKAPQMPSNIGRRPQLKTIATLQQDSSQSHEVAKAPPGENPPAPTSPSVHIPVLASSTAKEPRDQLDKAVEPDEIPEAVRNLCTRDEQNSPIGSNIPSNKMREREVSNITNERSRQTHTNPIGKGVEGTQASEPPRTSESRAGMEARFETHQTPQVRRRRSARHSTNIGREQASDSSKQTQLSSENLLKLVLHRQQQEKQAEAALRHELQDKENEILLLVHNMELLHENYDSAKRTVSTLRAQLSEKSDVVCKANDKVKRFQDFVKGLSSDHEVLKSDMRAFVDGLKILRDEKADLVAALDGTRASLETLSSRSRDASLEAHHQLELLSERLQGKDEQCKQLTKLLQVEKEHGFDLQKQLQAEAGRLRAEYDAAYTTQMDSLRKEASKLREDLHQKELAIRSVEEARTQMQQIKDRYHSSIESLKKEKEALELKVKERLEGYNVLKIENEKLDEELRGRGNEVQEVKESLALSLKANDELKSKCDNLLRECQQRGEILEIKQTELQNATHLLKAKETELAEMSTLREQVHSLTSERDSIRGLLKTREDALHESQALLQSQLPRMQRIPDLESRLNATLTEKDIQNRELYQRTIDLMSAKKELETKQAATERMAHYQKEAERLSQDLTQKEEDMVRQKNELDLARASLRSLPQKDLELTAAKARIQVLEDEQLKQGVDLVCEVQERMIIEDRLKSCENELRDLDVALSRQKENTSSEISTLRTQLEDERKNSSEHSIALADAKREVEFKAQQLHDLRNAMETVPAPRKSVIISSQVSTIAPQQTRRKAIRDPPVQPPVTRDPHESRANAGDNEVCIPESHPPEGIRSRRRSLTSDDELQYIASSPSTRHEPEKPTELPLPAKSNMIGTAASTAVANPKTPDTETSQNINTQQGSFLMNIPEPSSQLGTSPIGHATKLDLAAERRAKKQPIDTVSRSALQPPNTSNKRKLPTLPAVIPDSQSQSVQQSGPRSILKLSVSQRETWTTQVSELTGLSQTQSKKQRRSGVEDLGPILSSSPMHMPTAGKRKLSHRSTKRSDKFSQKFSQGSTQPT